MAEGNGEVFEGEKGHFTAETVTQDCVALEGYMSLAKRFTVTATGHISE